MCRGAAVDKVWESGRRRRRRSWWSARENYISKGDVVGRWVTGRDARDNSWVNTSVSKALRCSSQRVTFHPAAKKKRNAARAAAAKANTVRSLCIIHSVWLQNTETRTRKTTTAAVLWANRPATVCLLWKRQLPVRIPTPTCGRNNNSTTSFQLLTSRYGQFAGAGLQRLCWGVRCVRCTC